MKSIVEKDVVPLPADLVPASSDRSVLVTHAVVSPAPEPDLSAIRSDVVRHKSSLRRTGKALSSSVALAPREADTLNLLARGHTYAQTAVLLGVSVSTIQTYVKKIYRKLAVTSRSAAVLEAYRRGLLAADLFAKRR